MCVKKRPSSEEFMAWMVAFVIICRHVSIVKFLLMMFLENQGL